MLRRWSRKSSFPRRRHSRMMSFRQRLIRVMTAESPMSRSDASLRTAGDEVAINRRHCLSGRPEPLRKRTGQRRVALRSPPIESPNEGFVAECWAWMRANVHWYAISTAVHIGIRRVAADLGADSAGGEDESIVSAGR